jgi:hypothetical protein
MRSKHDLNVLSIETPRGNVLVEPIFLNQKIEMLTFLPFYTQ